MAAKLAVIHCSVSFKQQKEKKYGWQWKETHTPIWSWHLES
jgi:hypothetical protein